MVDIPRPDQARKKRIKRIIYGVATVVVITVISVAVSRLQPAAPTVDRAIVWLDTVKRGPLVRQVRGSGTLVPLEIRWIPAMTSGRVERIVLRPGATVTPSSVIVELSNPELQQQVMEAELAYRTAEAQFANRKADLQSQLLTQQAGLAGIEAQYREAALQLEADEDLHKQGITPDLTLKRSRSQVEQLRNRVEIEKKRLQLATEGVKSQLAPQQAEVEQRRAAADLRRSQLDNLRVRAGMNGVLQVVPVEVGAQVGAGSNVARVADPTNLKAEVRVAETQAKDIAIGQPAEVDTRNGIIKGVVARIDPAATNGQVGVDIRLEGALPRGARPDLSVDSTIELQRLDDVVFMGRPAIGQEHSTIQIFKVLPSGEAHRVTVKLGVSSVNTIEVEEGLQPGDQVILSDMSTWDAYDRVRISG